MISFQKDLHKVFTVKDVFGMAEWDLAEKVNKRLLIFAISSALILLAVLGVLGLFQRITDAEFEAGMARVETQNLKNSLIASNENVRILEEKLKSEDKELEAVSSSLNSKTEELNGIHEKDEHDHLPKTYPMKGNGMIDLPEETDEEVENPLPDTAIFFSMGEGGKALASGSGIVDSVSYDDRYGTLIDVDHGNGYHSFYYGKGGIVIVDEGEEVECGDVLIYFDGERNSFVYLVKYENDYVDPMELMDISG